MSDKSQQQPLSISAGGAAALAALFFVATAWFNPWNAIQSNVTLLVGQFIGYFFWGWIFAGINWLINRNKKTIDVSEFALKVAAVFLVLGGLVQLGKTFVDSPIQQVRTEAHSRCISSFQSAGTDPSISSEDIREVCACYSDYWADDLSKDDLRILFSGSRDVSWAEQRSHNANLSCSAGPLLLAVTVESANADLPMMIEEGLRLDQVSSEDGNLNYHYAFPAFALDADGAADSIDTDLAQQELAALVCNDSDTRPLLSYNFDVVFKYSDMHGNSVYDVAVTAEDCE